MNALQDKYGKEITAILKKYPDEHKRSAVMPLLYIAQREDGYVTKQDMEDIGAILGMTSTEVSSIVGFYTLYHDKPAGKVRIQVCNDLPCAMRGADVFLDELCDSLGVKVGQTTKDGFVTVEGVMCLAACDNAPMYQAQTYDGIEYHENQTVESTLKYIEDLRKKEAKKK